MLMGNKKAMNQSTPCRTLQFRPDSTKAPVLANPRISMLTGQMTRA